MDSGDSNGWDKLHEDKPTMDSGGKAAGRLTAAGRPGGAKRNWLVNACQAIHCHGRI